MVERETVTAKELESKPLSLWEAGYAYDKQLRQRAIDGKVVIRGRARPWLQGRQGKARYFVHPLVPDTAAIHWKVFVHDIRTHSGRHRHQGGLAIFVLEGSGWTMVDGVRYDWEAGDLLLLPVKPGGVEHQHFNADPAKACKWLALIYLPFKEALGSMYDQLESSPDWSGQV